MKKLNICKFILIINLLIFPFNIVMNTNLNNNINVVEEEKNKFQIKANNSKNIESIDCSYILENLGKSPYTNVKSIENEKNNIYVNLNYYGKNEELKNFLQKASSSKNFKGIKNLNMSTNKTNENNNENHNLYHKNNEDNFDDDGSDYEERQVDITLEYEKNLN
ncbi:hypothetical protein NRP93_001042 [Clostridium botulinum]|nr:hypothetical protein [Clostridium botulinum]